MAFTSVLFIRPDDIPGVDVEPAYFKDLNLDQVVQAMTRGRSEYNLAPFFYTSLHDVDAILYRQEVFRDLGETEVFAQIHTFGQKLRVMRERLTQAEKRYYPYQKAAWFRDAVEVYCGAIDDLASGLTDRPLASSGLCSFREYLLQYRRSDGFTELLADTELLRRELGSVHYRLHLKGQRIEVYPSADDQDYSAVIEKTFHKFKQGAVKQYRSTFRKDPDMNHVEASILDLVAKWYPEIFSHLQTYYTHRHDYLDPTIGRFDREIQFYLAVHEYVEGFKARGRSFCYPEPSDSKKNIFAKDGFDLALAETLKMEPSAIVCNDFHLAGAERILVVSGPNQGGKTTFARMFGQLHYWANLGCPTPAHAARLMVWDRLLTHFERQEDLGALRGKLQDDLERIHDILLVASSRSIIIMNEIFTSTTLQDAIFLSREILQRIQTLDSLAVCVTFIEELATLSEKTVSMVSTMAQDDPTQRTYKVVRRPQDGRAYAISIAEKYRVTYDWIQERIL